jgi:glyoxylase-like metal-dependent hydrolase (beta-lactamase superfamily II)
LLKRDSGPLAFSGDLILAGAKMHTWFDTEWDYGFASGIKALRDSVQRLSDARPVLLLPSHGPRIPDPQRQLGEYGQKLARLQPLYLRGYDPEGGSVAYQDKVSHPTIVSNIWQVSPHLFKFKRPNFWPNFSLILAENGHALLSDCGLLDEKFLDTALDGLRKHFGLKSIDAIIISHMHGDHFLEAPHLRAKWGAQIWALDNMVPKMEHPERFDYAASIQAYGKKNPDGSPMTGVRVDRALKPGESFEWEGYHFRVDWMPGQTEFALCLHGQIDGRKVAFTGDNIFGDPDNPAQTGHEAMVAHNSAILEEGYIHGAEFLKKLNPDLIMGGHSFVMDHPAAFVERYRRWSYAMRDMFQELSSEKDYRYWFDPFWVRAEPYRVWLNPGESAEVTLHVRNFAHTKQRHYIEIHAPPGLSVEPSVLEGSIGAQSKTALPIRVTLASNASPTVRLVGLDVTIDGDRLGERFDFVVGPGSPPPDPK